MIWQKHFPTLGCDFCRRWVCLCHLTGFAWAGIMNYWFILASIILYKSTFLHQGVICRGDGRRFFPPSPMVLDVQVTNLAIHMTPRISMSRHESSIRHCNVHMAKFTMETEGESATKNFCYRIVDQKRMEEKHWQNFQTLAKHNTCFCVLTWCIRV